MGSGRVPVALRTRLDDDATFGLLEFMDAERKDWSEGVLSVAADRFERRLTAEVAGVRLELHDGLAGVRQELHDGLAGVRQELHEGLAGVRQELHDGLTAVRQERHDGLTSVRQELATTRVEWVKWSFLFWAGNVAAMAGLLAFMLRGVK